MRKLTFERAVLIVLILIILISTSEYISSFFKREGNLPPDNKGSSTSQVIGFPSILKKADDLYDERDYEAAAKEYLLLTMNSSLSPEQKIHSNFRLGLSQYNLGNYKLAADSFERAASIDKDYSEAYNNAAVAAYKAMDLPRAIELEKKAIEALPAVEYFYNMARMYEDSGEYELAVVNYSIVTLAEENISLTECIDPVRVKDKVARLQSTKHIDTDDLISNSIKVFSLREKNDILTINENEMELKSRDFELKVTSLRFSKNIIGKYDRAKLDPYKLITEILWTVFKDGKQVYSKKSDTITYSAKTGGNYEIKLLIKYNGNKQLVSRKTVKLEEDKAPVIVTPKEDSKVVVVEPPAPTRIDKTYEYAAYEQLFEEDFDIGTRSYTDKYGVIWGKDDVQTQIVRKSVIDKQHSLEISNTGIVDGGLWANFDTFLVKENLKDSHIRISFYASSVSEQADIDVMIRIKNSQSIINIPINYKLGNKMEEKSIYLNLPNNTQGLTITLSTKPSQIIRIDGFTIAD